MMSELYDHQEYEIIDICKKYFKIGEFIELSFVIKNQPNMNC